MNGNVVPVRRIAGVAIFLLALGASVIAGVPADAAMPALALDWAILLHLERASLAVGVLGLATLMIWRAARGEFPVRFGHIEYEPESSATATKVTLAAIESRLVLLERLAGIRSNGVDELGDGA